MMMTTMKNPMMRHVMLCSVYAFDVLVDVTLPYSIAAAL